MVIIQIFIRICKCPCGFPCVQCNATCNNYAIVSKCITEKTFENDFVNNSMPAVFLCEKMNDLILINICDIVDICHYLSIDDRKFAIELINNKKVAR